MVKLSEAEKNFKRGEERKKSIPKYTSRIKSCYLTLAIGYHRCFVAPSNYNRAEKRILKMKLIGPWMSGYTRRVGITLKLLGIDFEHMDVNVFIHPEDVRPYSPMLKVPALVLDNGEVLLDSTSIIDYLHELVGPIQALIAIGGEERRATLRIVGIAMAVYDKLCSIHNESLRPDDSQLPSLAAFYTAQALTGLAMIEAVGKGRWLVGGALSQADIMAVVVYQSARDAILPHLVNASRFPELAALAEHAMLLPAFASTGSAATTFDCR